MKYLDLKTVVSLVLAGVALFFLPKWFTKRMMEKDGKISHYVGTEEMGYI